MKNVCDELEACTREQIQCINPGNILTINKRGRLPQNHHKLT